MPVETGIRHGDRREASPVAAGWPQACEKDRARDQYPRFGGRAGEVGFVPWSTATQSAVPVTEFNQQIAQAFAGLLDAGDRLECLPVLVQRLDQAVRLLESQATASAHLAAEVAELRFRVQRPDLVKYSIEEAAARLGRSRSSLYELMKAGEIVPVKERGRTFVTEEECQRWERAQRT